MNKELFWFSLWDHDTLVMIRANSYMDARLLADKIEDRGYHEPQDEKNAWLAGAWKLGKQIELEDI